MAKSNRLPQPVEVRAGMDDDFFYLGYDPYPGKEPLKLSLSNGLGYKAEHLYPNDDGSVTVEWMRLGFGFTPKERQENFYKYAADLVVPQLLDAVTTEVRFSGELETVSLQTLEIEHKPGSETYKVIRHRLGSMSLFAASRLSPDSASPTGASRNKQVAA